MSYPVILRHARLLEAVDDELVRARTKFKPINSAHEGYAVILEEVEEFWLEVMKKKAERSSEKMQKELIQVAAMAIRTIVDVIETGQDAEIEVGAQQSSSAPARADKGANGREG